MRTVLAVLFMFAAMAFLVWDSAPGVWRDYRTKDQFVPAMNSQITRAKCTNYMVFLANNCTVDVATSARDTKQSVNFWRLGRADEGRVFLLQNARQPGVFSTDVAMASLGNRAAFVVVVVLLFGVALFGFLKKLNNPDLNPDSAPAR
jgi:hypothetical protein